MRIPRYIFVLLVAVLTAVWFAESAAFEPVQSKMTQRLSQALVSKDRDEVISVMVYLGDGLDIAALDNSLTLAAAGRKERHSRVVGALLQAAGESQEPVLELLERTQETWQVSQREE